jgi:hypothetical protein
MAIATTPRIAEPTPASRLRWTLILASVGAFMTSLGHRGFSTANGVAFLLAFLLDRVVVHDRPDVPDRPRL